MTAALDDSDPQQIVAELQRQLDEALAQRSSDYNERIAHQAATNDVLKAMAASPGDPRPVFDVIVHRTRELCNAYAATLYGFDGDLIHLLSSTAFPSPELEAAYRRQFPMAPTRGGAFGRAILDRQIAHIRDVDADPELSQAVRNLGLKSMIGVPLLRDGAVIGVITANAKQPGGFSESQMELLKTFGEQAVIAITSAETYRELQQRTGDLHEALEQQTATAEVLGVINSSPRDLAPVFEAMLEKALRLCDAAFGTLFTRDGDVGRLVAWRNVPDAFAEYLTRNPMKLSTILGPDFRNGPVIHIKDLAAGAPYRDGIPLAVAAVDLGGIRSLLVVPLMKDGMLIGLFAIYGHDARRFSDKQIALLQNFAAQAVIAMENARLITETREALEQQTATAEVLGVINSSPGELVTVFEVMLETAARLCGADGSRLYLCIGEAVRVAAQHGKFATGIGDAGKPFVPHPDTALAQALKIRKPTKIDDTAPYFAHAMAADDDWVQRPSVAEGWRSLFVVPMLRENELVGAIATYRREARSFEAKHIGLIENFAAQAVIAMENARLITETREALEQQTATAEVLGVINSSPGDLAPVFDAILEKALFLCDAAFGVLWTKDDELYRAAALRGVPPAYAEFVTREPRGHEPGGVLGLLARGEALVHVPDNASSAPDQMARTHAELTGARTVLAVPLRKDEALLGAFVIYRQEVRPFTDKQIALLQNFAAQAVIAMENARLLGELRQRTEEVAELNRGLEARVAEQVEELGRVGRLKRFLAPQLAELIVSQGDEKILESHRREIVVVFCDLRGYTAFTETAEPEEVLDFLREYHGALGPLVAQFEGTLDQFSGDGIMVFFNDPVPIPDPAERAVKMAVAMREVAGQLIAAWRERGRDLGFGVGIAQGYATLGQIGFSERSGYTAIGTVCNVAARLCAEAKDAQILLTQRVNVALKGSVATEQVGALALKGLTQPVVAYNVPLVSGQAALRVIDGGAPSA